jgi:flavodoxin
VNALVVAYSLSGNNTLLADHLAGQLEADRADINPDRSMGMFQIALDALFNRSPKLKPEHRDPGGYDVVVLAGPIWMGKIASPIRSYVEEFRSHLRTIAFVSACGGALGPNEKVGAQVKKLIGEDPVAFKQLYINDLLPAEQQNDSKATSAYTVTSADLEGGWKTDIDEFVRQVRAASD